LIVVSVGGEDVDNVLAFVGLEEAEGWLADLLVREFR
jgi:hypothetical protein